MALCTAYLLVRREIRKVLPENMDNPNTFFYFPAGKKNLVPLVTINGETTGHFCSQHQNDNDVGNDSSLKCLMFKTV